MTKLLDILKERVLVGDGAMGTQLFEAGLPAGACAEEWNVTHADEVRRIQRAYVEAGADFLLTNTFGGNRISLRRHGLDEQIEAFNAAAVENARAAGGPETLVLGDIGPTGALPEPFGDCTEHDLFEVFLEQAKVLCAENVDALAIQTITSVEEMRAAVRAAKQAGGVPVIASAGYDPTPDGSAFRTMMGVSVEAMMQAALEAGADVVGANCGSVNMRDMVAIAGAIRAITPKPIMIEANAGRPEIVAGKTVHPESPDQFSKSVGDLLKLGVRIIGGCCGTTPAHIRAVAAVVKGI